MTSREYLFALEAFGIKLGLEQIRSLLDRLQQPDRSYRSILVAGTNGKGSVTAMVERAFRAAGYRTGRYTSPHLVSIEERITIDGRPIDAAEFDAVADRVREAAGALPAPPTFFEATTAIALDAFRRAEVDVAVMEVGLGGRLDATNVLSPMGVAITAIAFDHEEHLGSTIEAIAAEKAGVIKPAGLCVLGENSQAVRTIMETLCASVGAELVFAPDGVHCETTMVEGCTRLTLRTPARDYGTVGLALRGRHQVANVVTAVRLLECLERRSGLRVPADAVRTGLTDVDWPARLEVRRWDGHEIVIDGAHNPAGAQALAAYLAEVYARPLPIVLGVMRDKNIAAIAAALAPHASGFFCTAPRSPRAASPAALAAVVRAQAPQTLVREVSSPIVALGAALSLGDPVVVAGSLYLAGQIRSELS